MPFTENDLNLARSFMAPPRAARPGSRRLPTPPPSRRGMVGQMPVAPLMPGAMPGASMMPMTSTADYMGSPAGRELLRRVLDGLRKVR